MLGPEAAGGIAERLLWLAEAVAGPGAAMGLTGRTSPEEVVQKDLPDAIALVAVLRRYGSEDLRNRSKYPFGRLLDLGTGAGLPGLPAAILEPGLEVDLIDRREKCGAFIGPLLVRLGVDNAMFHVKPSGTYDSATARATMGPGDLLDEVMDLVSARGSIVLLTGGGSVLAEEACRVRALRVLGIHLYRNGAGEELKATVVENLLKGG